MDEAGFSNFMLSEIYIVFFPDLTEPNNLQHLKTLVGWKLDQKMENTKSINVDFGCRCENSLPSQALEKLPETLCINNYI